MRDPERVRRVARRTEEGGGGVGALGVGKGGDEIHPRGDFSTSFYVVAGRCRERQRQRDGKKSGIRGRRTGNGESPRGYSPQVVLASSLGARIAGEREYSVTGTRQK